MFKRVLILLSIIAIATNFAMAEITLPSFYGNNMVLQQHSTVQLRGTASPSSRLSIKASWAKTPVVTTANAQGKWSAALATPAAGGPYSISIKGDGTKEKGSLLLSDVLVGEVWICSGQSNMEMPLRGFRGQPVKGSAQYIAGAKPTRELRLYQQPNDWSTSEENDIHAKWTVASSANAAPFSAVGYIFGEMLQNSLDIPVGIIQCAWSMSNIETWMPRSTLSSEFPEVKLPDVDGKDFGWIQGTPTLVWNAMVAPWKGFPIAGVIWYQGEANAHAADKYRSLFPAMVRDWRKLFNNEAMPFYYAQLAPWRNDGCKKTQWAKFRQVQNELLSIVPHSGMVTTSDLGDSIFIHSPHKIDVAKRFAYLALENKYGFAGLDSKAPMAKNVTTEADTAFVIEFENAANGLTPENASLQGFEIVDEQGNVCPAKAAIINATNKVRILNPGVEYPAEVRYGYHNYYESSLFNNIGIPAAPFAMKLPRKHKMALMWIDGAGNYKHFQDPDTVDYYVKKIHDLGFTHAVVGIRPITGEVLYDSKIAPRVPGLRPGYDYLGTFIEAGKKHGLKIIASMNVFCAGHNYHDSGMIYNGHPEWASTVYDPMRGIVPITQQKEKYGAMVNPNNEEYQNYILEVMKEIITKYPQLDGLMTDRVRFDGIQADFSNLSRKKFEQFLGKKIKNFPNDILSWDLKGKHPKPIPGKFFKEWIEWRARVITDFIARARKEIKAIDPNMPFCTYTGAWYPSYYEVGVNFASKDYDPAKDFDWASPDYKDTGYAELIDIYTTGNYYTDITIDDYIAKGGSEIWNETDSQAQSGTWYCVEGSCKNLRKIMGKNKFLGGILVDQFYDNTPNLTRTIAENLKDSDGLMVFDLCHIINKNLWKEVEKGMDYYNE